MRCLDNNELTEINPNTYSGLRHGYASTVYQAQGATLDHVYVLHSTTTNQSTNYVALTRQAKSLHLYLSRDETPSHASLIHQMERHDGNRTSLVFDTLQDIEKKQEEKSFVSQIKQKAATILNKIKDVFHRHEKFYQFKPIANVSQEKAEIVVHKPHGEMKSGRDQTEESCFQKKPVQEISPSKSREANINSPLKSSPRPHDAKVIELALRQNMSSFADDIFSSLGEPYNPAASSNHERRYGKKGHIAVNLKTGSWIDYKDDNQSGGPLHMLTKLKKLSFKEALSYGATWAGLSQQSFSQKDVSQLSMGDKASPQSDERNAENKEKIEKAKSLWNKGWAIQGTLAEQYLREHRKIEGDLPGDLRYLPVFKDNQSNRSFPCLMAGARSPSGEITAVQLTFLDPETKGKADVDIAKKSFGVIKGSAVTLQAARREGVLGEPPHIFFIAEGVETALSLKSARVQGNIKASLGLSNMKRIVPERRGTPIVICADHDAPQTSAAKSLEKSVMTLQMSSYSVTVIKPDQLGDDFNDVLKKQGSQGVREAIERGLEKENVLEKEQLDKVFAKTLHAELTPVRKLSAEKLAIMARIAREQELQGYGSSAGAQSSSSSLRGQKPHLKKIDEMEMER